MKMTFVNRFCIGFLEVCQFKLINCFILNLGCSDPSKTPKTGFQRVPLFALYKSITYPSTI